MAIVLHNESVLTSTSSYNSYASGASTNPLELATTMIKTAKRLTKEDIEPAYLDMKKYSNSLTRLAVREYEVGNTVLLYNPDQTKGMISLIPFFTVHSKNSNVRQTYVFMNNLIDLDVYRRTGAYKIMNPGHLHDLLVGAMLSSAIRNNPSRLTGSEYLERTLMSLYTAFVCRIINKLYSISPDKILFDSVQYCTNRFFLETVLESVSSGKDALALKQLKYLDPVKIDQLRSQYTAPEYSVTNLQSLLVLLQSFSPILKPLTFRAFVNDWINYYRAPVYLAMDNIEYLVFMVVCLKNKNNLASIGASSIVDETKGIKMIEEELLKIATP